MNDKEKMVMRYIRNLKPIIMQDNRIDMVETAWLLKALNQDEKMLTPEMKDFIKLLREVREDGVVTEEESNRIIEALNAILSNVDK